MSQLARPVNVNLWIGDLSGTNHWLAKAATLSRSPVTDFHPAQHAIQRSVQHPELMKTSYKP